MFGGVNKTNSLTPVFVVDVKIIMWLLNVEVISNRSMNRNQLKTHNKKIDGDRRSKFADVIQWRSLALGVMCDGLSLG